MKTFKRIDFFGQIILVVGFTIASLVNLDSTFLIGYCVVGGWQFISMIVHFVNRWYCPKGSRRYNYTIVSFFTVLLMLSVYVLPGVIYFLFIMVFAAPVMAIYYAALCYKEVYYYSKRPLELT
jgi:hypothetical protein